MTGTTYSGSGYRPIAILGGATPQLIGNSYLRLLYDELHALEARGNDGRLNYFSVIQLK
jgi:hypothetical protein